MRTRIHKWISLDFRNGKRRTRLTADVRYGVQAHVGGEWKHCHRNGKPLIFTALARAETERAKLRRMGEA